ncbi:50S ribosomal protein L18a [Candidatus Micrarchaeota archaeon]|nr:50S ribosomal protein L18a [Candidatus Micrarchaeota archaeon]
MKRFSISGSINIGSIRPFTKEVDAATENAAKSKLYALFGSNNGIKRSKVKIEKIEQL